jgi:hypothetical protein
MSYQMSDVSELSKVLEKLGDGSDSVNGGKTGVGQITEHAIVQDSGY